MTIRSICLAPLSVSNIQCSNLPPPFEVCPKKNVNTMKLMGLIQYTI